MEIASEKINFLLDKANIVEVIGKYVEIQKKGSEYVCTCPFHDDKNPSMIISPTKKIFKCFPCGIGGNVIVFIEKYHKVNFINALKILANDLNIEIEGLDQSSLQSKYSESEMNLFNINKTIGQFFNGMIVSDLAQEAINYLESRKIFAEQINKYNIGFCSSKIDIYEYLIANNFSPKDIDNAKIMNDNNKCFFNNRIIFPITNEDGYIIGFSGRAIHEDQSPKYLNSRETLVFKKSKIAYNLFNAKNEIKLKNEIIILEGFMDVISLEAIEIKNAVAIMGTSLTNEHIETFSKYTKNFKLFLDGDDPGINSAIKNSKSLMLKNLSVKIIENNTGKDPDELVKENKKNLIYEMIDNAVHPIFFSIKYFSKQFNLKDSIDKEKFIDKVFEIAKNEKSEIIINDVINCIADLTKVDIQIIKNKFNSIIIKNDQTKNNYKNSYVNYENENFIVPPEIIEQENELPEEVFATYQNNLDFLSQEIKKDIKSVDLGKKRIVLSLIREENFFNVIEPFLDELNDTFIKLLLKKIYSLYEKKIYKGNDAAFLIEEFKKDNEKYSIYIDEIISSHLSISKKSLTSKGVKDIITKINILKKNKEIKQYTKELSQQTDYEDKMLTLKFIIKIEKLRNKIKDEGKKNNGT